MIRRSAYVNVPLEPLPATWTLEDEHVEEEVENEEEARYKMERWLKKKNNTELIGAILKSDSDEVRRLLVSGVSPLVRCQQSMATGLHLAAFKGNDQILRELLESCRMRHLGDAGTRAKDRDGRQPHHLAAASGNLKVLKTLLRADPELVNSQITKDPRLDSTVREDMLDSFLHDHSVVSNILPNLTEGSTALHIASKQNYVELVNYLISQNATTNIKDKDGLTPLDVAGLYACPTDLRSEISRAVSEYSSLTDAPELLDFETTEADGEVVISPSLRGANFNAISNFKPKNSRILDVETLNSTMNVVSSLIKSGGVLSEVKRKKTTPLHKYVEKHDMNSINNLLSSNNGFKLSDIKTLLNTMDGNGKTPVHVAMEKQLLEALKTFFKIDKTLVNSQDNSGRTPLHIAVQNKWLGGIELCLEYNGDIGCETSHKETVIHFAAKIGDPTILSSLLERTSKTVVNQRDIFGYTALFRSIDEKHEACVKVLLEYCTPRKYISGRTSLLHAAVLSNVESIIRLILEKLALKPDAFLRVDMSGCTPLHLSVKENRLNSLRYLLSLQDAFTNIDFEQQSEEGGNILHIAAQAGHHEALEIILSHNFAESLISKRDKKQCEPLVVAARGGYSECVKLLLKHGANLAAKDFSTDRPALELIHVNIPHSGRLLDDILDSFMIRSQDREDSLNSHVTLDYKCLLADSKSDNRQLGVIDAFIKCGHERLRQRLFLHPLTESFLFFKWNQLKILFRLLTIIFLVHILALTAHAISTYVHPAPQYLIWPWKTIVLGMNVIILCLELLYLRSDKSYWIDAETWVKWSVIISSTLVCALGSYEWMRYLTSVAVLLAWIELLFLVARNPRWGLRVLMFFEVAANVFQVLTTFVFLILGFAFAFLILFNGQHPFTNIGTTLSKILIMMVELDYNGVYDSEETATMDANGILGRLLYLGFVVLVVMVLTNLMVGMSVSDVAELETQGRSKRMAKQASFLVFFEKICYGNWCTSLRQYMHMYRSAPENTIVWLNKKHHKHENPLPGHLKRSIYLALHHQDDHAELEDLHSKIEKLTEEVYHISQSVNEMKESLFAAINNT